MLSLLVATGLAFAQPDSDRAGTVRAELDAVREDLEALRIERALAVLDLLARREDLSDEERLDLLGLRAQAHVVSGKLDLAEGDFRDLLRLDPDYEPDPRVFPPKAISRFGRAREAVTGLLRLRADPEDSTVLVDGRQRSLAASGSLRLAEGEHRLRVERRGYDAAELPFRILPGEETSLEVRLDPNARSVVVRTELEGVEVELDGTPAGRTVRPPGRASEPGAPAELLLEDVPLGEHALKLAKPCFRDEATRILVAADLAHRSPLLLDVVPQIPARAGLVFSGLPRASEVFLDGARLDVPDSGPIPVCPGHHEIEVHAGGRPVYSGRVRLATDETTEVDVRPAPFVVLVGTEDWPPILRPLAGQGLLVRAKVGLPHEGDLRKPEGWQGLDMPAHTDLAVAQLEPEAEDVGPTVWVFSPLLKTVESIHRAGPEHGKPEFLACDPGMGLADSRLGGPARVVVVRSGGPAEAAGIRPGDRLLSVAGRSVESSRDARRALASAGPGAEVELELRTAEPGTTRKVRLVCGRSPVLLPPPREPGEAAFRAAWASVEAASNPTAAASALANLALLLSWAGRHQAAADLWRRVRFGDRPGIGDGLVAYFLARALEEAGQEEAARDLYEKAARSEATAFSDWGPPIAPAAADHGRDLGAGAPVTAR
jgi:hypothetical protein